MEVCACFPVVISTAVQAGVENTDMQLSVLYCNCELVARCPCYACCCQSCQLKVTFGELVMACFLMHVRLITIHFCMQGDAETVAGYASLLEMRKAEAQKSAQESAGGGGGGASDGLPPGLKAEPVYALSNPGAKDGETKVWCSKDVCNSQAVP